MIAAFAAGFQHTPLAFQLADFGGRSGYWRLVFAKLQEEALKKPEPEKKEEPAVITETKAPAKKPKIVRRKPLVEQPTTHERLVVPVKVMPAARTLLEDLAALAPLSMEDVKIDFSKVAKQAAEVEIKKIRRKRRQVEELLLLLAA